MTSLCFIACRFKPTKNDDFIYGFAICDDADTPVTFIYPDGKPLLSDEIWDYRLSHFSPWAKLETEQ